MHTWRLYFAAFVGLATLSHALWARAEPPADADGSPRTELSLTEDDGLWVSFAALSAESPTAEHPQDDADALAQLESALKEKAGELSWGDIYPTGAVSDVLLVLEAWRDGDATALVEHRLDRGLALNTQFVRRSLVGCARWGWINEDRARTIEAAGDYELVALLAEAQRGSGFVVTEVDLDSIEVGFGVTATMRTPEWPAAGMISSPCALLAPQGLPEDLDQIEDTPATMHVRLRVRFEAVGLGFVRLGYVFNEATGAWIPIGSATVSAEPTDRTLACLVN